MTKGALLALLVLAACVGAIVGDLVDGPKAMLAAQAALAILVVEGFRRLDLARRRLAAAGEMLALGMVVLVGLAVVGTAEHALASILLAISVWLLGVVSAADLDAVAAPTDLVEGIKGPSARLAGRHLWVGVVLALIGAAAVRGWAPPQAPTPSSGAVLLPLLIYWVVGLVSLGMINRDRLLSRWRLEGVRVNPDLDLRWKRALAVGASALVVVGLVWWWVGFFSLTGGHWLAARLMGGTAALYRRFTGAEPEPPSAREGQPGPVEPPDPLNPITPPAEVWDLLLLLGIGVLFAGAFAMFQARRAATSMVTSERFPWWKILTELRQALWSLLRSILSLFRFHRRWSSPGSPSPRLFGAGGGRVAAWEPPDPVRARIARAYRSQTALAGAVHGPPTTGETSIEYAHRIQPDESFVDLAGLYSEARFSIHPLEPVMAEMAESIDVKLTPLWPT